jgi:hypothetical protein
MNRTLIVALLVFLALGGLFFALGAGSTGSRLSPLRVTTDRTG